MSTLVGERVRGVLRRARLEGRSLLLALSGGIDSVVLLGVLAEDRGEGRLEVAHVDHGLRPDSADDARFCAELAESRGLRYHLHRVEPGRLAGGNLQAKAREIRRGFLCDLQIRRGLAAVALAHHADDQVETVLFRLLRGTGPRGAGGMRAFDPPWVRPFLGVRRTEIESLAEARGWAHREDSSNRETVYARNRLRRLALPVLRDVHPGVDRSILRWADLAAEEDLFLTRMARDALTRIVRVEPEGVWVGAGDLARLDPVLRRRALLALWEAAGGDPGRLEARHLAEVSGLLGPGRAHRRAPVPGPCAFVRSYDALWCLSPGVLEDRVFEVSLRGPGRTALGGGRWLVWGARPPAGRPAAGVPPGTGSLWARSRRPGDRIFLGGSRAPKAKDLLMDARLPLWRRNEAPVVGRGPGSAPFALLSEHHAWGGGGSDGGWVWLERDGEPTHPFFEVSGPNEGLP